MSILIERFREIASFIAVTLLNPGWNARGAQALYAALGSLLLLVVVIVTLLVMGAMDRRKASGVAPPSDESAGDDEFWDDDAWDEDAGDETLGGDGVIESAPSPQPERRPRERMSPRMRLLAWAGFALVIVAVWVAAGYTTSDSQSCNSCHAGTSAHSKAAKGTNRHAQIECVSCHEPRGFVGRFITGVPLRLLHFAVAPGGASPGIGYGLVTAQACTSCHRSSLSGTTTNAKRGLKMSHKAPIAASATCVDCHTLRGGVVGAYNAGMKPCARCHDGEKASSKCDTCHVGGVVTNTRDRSTSLQGEQVTDVRCGGCHDEKRSCDPCHGVRMPHTAEFMASSHARAATVDFWYNNGNTCRRCHTPQQRPCSKCHTKMLGSAHGLSTNLATGHQKALSASCNTCHGQYAPIKTRDFCKDVCHSDAAKAASPR